jgi:uncharacterized protein (TIGR00730 family)
VVSLHRICVFCGSNAGTRPIYSAVARHLGETMARRGIGLVTGGGKVGLMGAVADAVLAAGGEAIGVIPEQLVAREIAHAGLTDLRIVRTMHERKALMADLADAFIALPGGYGTLDEFCEALTWSQLGIHKNPCGLLNVDGYWDSLLETFDRAVAEGFLRPENRQLVLTATDADSMLTALENFRPVSVEKWITEQAR